jgi:putative transposase
MAQSLSKLYVHLIFHIKNNHVKIRINDKNDLYAYMGSIIKDNDSIPILINGTEDHVHVLCIMGTSINSFWNTKAGIFFRYKAPKTEFSIAK